MKRISKLLVVTILSIFVVSLFGCFGADGTASTGYYSDYDEEKIEVVVDTTDGTKTTYHYSILKEQEKLKKFSEDLVAKATAYTDGKVLYEYLPTSNDGAVYYYVKLVVKIPTEKVADYTAYIKANASDISSISVEKIAVNTDLTDVHFSKIDIELNAGGSSSGSDTTNIVIYVFLGLIVALIIGSSIYKFVKAKKAVKKQAEAPQEENQDNNSENKGGDFFS